MNAYEKSLLKQCLTLAGITQWYADTMPEDFYVPCIYFPAVYADPQSSTLNEYAARKTIYAKVFASTRREAGELAEKIADGIMEKRRLIPLLEQDGTESGETFKVEPPVTSVIDDGTAQIVLTYNLRKRFYEDESTGIHEIIITQEIRD